MRTNFLRPVICLALLLLSLVLVVSQKTSTGFNDLLKQYSAAQQYYDRATRLSSAPTYGAREEQLEKEWNQKALEGFQTVYKNIPATNPFYDSLRFHTSFKIGELQHYFENFKEAVFYYRQSIAIKEKRTLPDSLFFKPYLYAGIIFYNQNKFDTAVSFFKKAEEIQATYQNKLTEGERLYNILGVLYYERGDYRQAQNYFQKALALLPLSHPYYNELFVNYKINLAQLHLRLEEYDKANEIYLELLPRKINLNEIYHNIGSLNLSLGAAEKAILYFRKVHYQSNKIVRLYNSMGEAFFNLLQTDSAKAYYQKAINEYRLLGTNSDPVGYGMVLKNLGQYQVYFKKYTEALNYFQQAIREFYPAFKNNAISSNPESFSGVFSYINLFNTLTAKAEAWHYIYLTTSDLQAAKEELRSYQSAFKLIEYVEQTYDSDEARLFLIKTKHAVHGKPIDIAFELYSKTHDDSYLETLYNFDQQNKAAVLSLNRQMNNSVSETTSPLLQKEQEIKTEITRLSIRATQVSDSTQLAAINNNIRDLEIALGKNRELLYPKTLLKEGNIPSISFLQHSLLDDKTILVSYHLSDEKMTTLVVTKKKVACTQTTLPADFTDKMLELIRSMKTPQARLANEKSTDYYGLFLSALPMEEMQQLIIIPDDVLAYFPFETLQDSQGKYLVEKIAVQYQFSTALLGKNETDFSNATTLSFAPFAHQGFSDSFPSLPASAQEVSEAGGQRFFDSAATKAKFLQQSSAFKIMHLATHAVANSSAEKLSYIAFSPAKGQDYLLYAQEIYNLQLQNSGLVILSACETGAGQLVKGEGILSLSRAFAYAGCPNIITSLWKADDFATANLTSRIHRYLSAGLSISSAVQKAKIDYLHDRKINPRLKHPYYWSHLVFIGNYTPEKSFNPAWLMVVAAIGSLILFLLLKKPGVARHSGSHRRKYS